MRVIDSSIQTFMPHPACSVCQTCQADEGNPLVILLQKKVKENGVRIRYTQEIGMPVCTRCLLIERKRASKAQTMGGIVWIIFILVGLIWGLAAFISPGEAEPTKALFSLLLLGTSVGLLSCLAIIRFSVPEHIRHYQTVETFKKDGWHISSYVPVK